MLDVVPEVLDATAAIFTAHTQYSGIAGDTITNAPRPSLMDSIAQANYMVIAPVAVGCSSIRGSRDDYLAA